MERYVPMLSEYGTKSPAELPWGPKPLSNSPQTCAEVPATPKIYYSISQIL